MKVKKLRKLLEDIPDNYEIRTRPCNAALNSNEDLWQLNFSGEIVEIELVHSYKIVMLIRGFE